MEVVWGVGTKESARERVARGLGVGTDRDRERKRAASGPWGWCAHGSGGFPGGKQPVVSAGLPEQWEEGLRTAAGAESYTQRWFHLRKRIISLYLCIAGRQNVKIAQCGRKELQKQKVLVIIPNHINKLPKRK